MVELFPNLKIDWLGKRKLFIAISIVLVLIGMGSLIRQGEFNYGLDFRGGTLVNVRFNEAIDITALRDILPEANIQVKGRTGDEFQIELARGSEQDATAGRELVESRLNEKLAGKYEIRNASGVSAKVGEDLRRKAVMATLYALGGILVYIALRFEWIYGAVAVFAVFHDAIVTLGLFSLFNYEINLTVIAALLTLVGYSVNDTIVIFDRVRENAKLRRVGDLEEMLNESINQTMSRTILTSGLTFLAVLALYLFGGDAIRDFAFALVVGVVVGSYSTIAIAAPIVLVYTRMRQSRIPAPAVAPRTPRPARVK